jgi:mannose-1-phosphate guanylyltransferase
MKNYVLIMAGGVGSRFWPESTSKRPKQYLSIVGTESLLLQTLKRVEGFAAVADRYVVSVKKQKELIIECSSKELEKNHIILEPEGRNTAPCIFLSILRLLKDGANPSDVVAILPSDHVILNQTNFRADLDLASDLARQEKMIVTIGIKPHFPHTGYGYIKKGKSLVTTNSYLVSQFVEKPNLETAKSYLSSGDYAWNAGMFVSTIDVLMGEFASCAPEYMKHKAELESVLDIEDKVSHLYSKLPSNSIDYAIMEKSKRVAMLEASFDWNDLGSWDALSAVVEKREENYLAKVQDFHFIDSKNNIIFVDKKMISLIGINNLIIVENKDVLFIVPKDRAQEVKNVVKHLEKNRPDLT